MPLDVGGSLTTWRDREHGACTQKGPSQAADLNQGPRYCEAIVLTTAPLARRLKKIDHIVVAM